MDIDEYFDIYTGGNGFVETLKPIALKDFAEAYHKIKLKELELIIKSVDSIIKYNSRQFTCADSLVIIAILIATETLTKTPFRLQRSTVSSTGLIENSESNTHVLLPVGSIKKQKLILERMLLAAFTITTE